MHHRVHTAGLLVSGLLLAACGAPLTSNSAGSKKSKESKAYAKYEGLTGKERTDKLLADAKSQGGVLDLHTSNTDIQDLVDGIHKAYPRINVHAFRANSETVLQRALHENQANKPQNDVMDTNDLELRALDAQHLLHPYKGP